MSPFDYLFAGFAFFLGASIGSFLNVCIYRMPRDLSVNNPKRSFCPNCQYQIPWYRNLPLLSWLQLRGRCANCGAPIAFRYFGVELLTALLFLAVWLKFWPAQWILALPYWVLVGILVTATFIDFEHFIIPDELTWGGAAVGIVLSLIFPAMQGEEGFLLGGAWSFAGAALGFVLLRLVVELGKMAFGKKRFEYSPPAEMSWVRTNDEAELIVGEEKVAWSEVFGRESDQLTMECGEMTIDAETKGEGTYIWTLDWLKLGDKEWKLDKIDKIAGKVKRMNFPREAMGLGDVKFIAAIGAFLGWQAVLFTIVAASMVGAMVGSIAILLKHREWSGRIPFGPYLALGALGWLFIGPQLVGWYLEFAMPAPQ